MLLPVSPILDALTREVSRLGAAGAVAAGVAASAEQSVGLALGLLSAREGGGADGVRAQFQRLADALASWPTEALPSSGGDEALAALRAQVMAQVMTQVQGAMDSAGNLAALEDAWRTSLRQVEALVQQGLRDSRLGAAARARLSGLLVAWEAADLQAQMAASPAADAGPGTAVDAPRLQAYLQDRFDEPGLQLTEFRPLPGGFGKETYLFAVRGNALDGGFVMRRDPGAPVVDNDCHRIHHEYALIRAVHARGFPAPEALWCDTEHRLLPGGDFLVMRRAPGAPGGSAFAASGAVPADLGQTLAGILARLHALPPLDELGALTDSLHTERAALPLQDCTRRYLEDWLALYTRTAHLPSPALLSQFGWLLDNVPQATGRPVLLHGDIGFHNFLFEDTGKQGGRRLTAVLDWEFGHLGDPAEDLAYVRNTVGAALDWPTFLAAYQAAGGAAVDDERIRFFEVWGHVRNAASSALAVGQFMQGGIPELKLVQLPHLYIPLFLRAAQASIERQTANATLG